MPSCQYKRVPLHRIRNQTIESFVVDFEAAEQHLPNRADLLPSLISKVCEPMMAISADLLALGAGAVPPGTYCQTLQCHLFKRPRLRGLPD